ncbi:MAG: PIG-L family deacetylase [Anaerolineales bacterium]|nr:PIG-L family deacetylase [Anaerolineales bacterium]
MRWIYISPHLDDAVLSAGGLIHKQVRSGQQVEIWNILGGFPPTEELSPFAQLLHFQWGISSTDELIRARRAEDEKACRRVGAKPIYFDYLDCIYRRGKNGDWLYSYIFVPPHEDETDFPAQVADSISARLQPTDQLVCQLGLGSHVDHVLVRRAVELLQRPILYYIDIPYLFKTPEELGPQTAGMKANAYEVSEAGLKSWQEAIAEYESQISSLFDDVDHMRSQIRQYWSENGGIRLWSSA